MADAKEEKLERAKMDWAKLEDTIRNGLRFDKKTVSLNCPGIGLIPTTRTNTKVPIFMAGKTPERPVVYADKVQMLKEFYSAGVMDYDIKKELFIQDSIRFVRMPKNEAGRKIFIKIIRALCWVGSGLGFRANDLARVVYDFFKEKEEIERG